MSPHLDQILNLILNCKLGLYYKENKYICYPLRDKNIFSLTITFSVNPLF